MKLTDIEIRQASAKDKDYKLYDEKCLFAKIKKSGKKYWYVRYTKNKKSHEVMVGKYPEMSLKEARKKRDEIKKTEKKLINPFKDLTENEQYLINKIKEAVVQSIKKEISKEIKILLIELIQQTKDASNKCGSINYDPISKWKYLRLKQIIGDKNSNPPIEPIVPVSKSSWYAGIEKGIYPKPIKTGKRISLWRTKDIEELMSKYR